MEFISSDANVWIDFKEMNKLELPFKLPYQYIMYHESLDSEISGVDKLADKLLICGLKSIKISITEFNLAMLYANKYRKLSTQDSIALAIAKIRNIKLLTGDGNLRKAANEEKVNVVGTIWILDELLIKYLISNSEYCECIDILLDLIEKGRRLPKDELLKRKQQVEKML